MTRAVAGVVVTLPEPAIADGHPSVPLYWARFAAAVVLKEGPLHIHAIKDPNPIWNPYTGGWTYPPPPPPPPPVPKPGSGPTPNPGVGDYRWNVDSLPDPGSFSRGWYWLGDATSQDGTDGIDGGARQWGPAAGSSGPTWHSHYPHKPSVNSYDGFIYGERTVHHPKGVHFNSHYIEHMWLDLYGPKAAPCTWIVVATIMSDDYPGYQHNILDAGRNPDDVGFPRISAGDCSSEWRVADGLPYRNSLSIQDGTAMMFAQNGNNPLRTRSASGHHPRMFATVYNGTSSLLAVYDPFGRNISVGSVAVGSALAQRYVVLGREQSWMSQNHATNMLVFEIRYWHHALSKADLDSQYAQLSSTYQLDAYRNL